MSNRKGSYCLNCNAEFDQKIKSYCPSCGQKSRETTISFLDTVKEFFSELLSYDNKVFKTIVSLLKPAYLSFEYFKGRRTAFINPFRLFFFLLVILFAVYALAMRFVDFDNLFMDNQKHIVITNIKNDIRQKISPETNCEETISKIDSLISIGHIDYECESDFSKEGGVININLSGIEISVYDVLTLSDEELYRKYDITEWIDRFFVKQSIKNYKNLSSVYSFLLGNAIWIFILQAFIMALFMKVLYLRNNIYYSEHLVVQTHIQSFIVLMLILLSGIMYLIVGDFSALALSYLFVFPLFLIYSFLSIKRYYQDPAWKFAIKFSLYHIFYFLSVAFIFILILLISFILF